MSPVLASFVEEFQTAPVTLILALVAILFAAVQFFDSVHLKRKMTKVLSNEDDLIKRGEILMTKTERELKEIGLVATQLKLSLDNEQTLLGRVDALTTRTEQEIHQIESVTTRLDAITTSIQKATASIEDVERSLSSRFAGLFPKNIKQITEVVGRADRYLFILTDWVGYAMYSSPREYEDYKRQLHDLRTRVNVSCSVHILAYSDAFLKTHFEEQFLRDDFTEEKKKPRFRNFFEVHHRARRAPDTYDEFFEELLRLEREERHELQDIGVSIQELDRRSLLLLWLEDGEDAVFCFQTSGNERGLSFRTRDTGLLTSLHDVFGSHWKGDLPQPPHARSIQVQTPTRPTVQQ